MLESLPAQGRDETSVLGRREPQKSSLWVVLNGVHENRTDRQLQFQEVYFDYQ